MNREQYQRLRAIFHHACETAEADRAAFLKGACASDEELRREVEALLVRDRNDIRGLQSPLPASSVIHEVALEAQDDSLPVSVGRFHIVRKLGEGGMGIVYEALQDSPRRSVALKVLRSGMASPGLQHRFQREAAILGQLQHPGIAQVYEMGVGAIRFGTDASAAQGAKVPFFAMEYVRGRSLTEFAADRELGTRQRLDLFAKLCEAIQYAHGRGVIHRDLKPANILVDENGQPKVLDFGVARVTGSDLQITTAHTDVGQLIGTLSYMSPEQIAGDKTLLDARSDLYALGVILFELLCGRLPHDLRGRSFTDAARIIREEEPSRLSSINPLLHGDLETIVGKALEKDPSRRYTSAAELAADIGRYLREEPIIARPASKLYQLRKFARRNKTLVGGVAATILALALGLIGTTHWARRELRQRNEAERQTYRAMLAAAAAASRENDVSDVKSALAGAPEHLRGWEWSHFHSRLDDSLMSWTIGPPVGTRASFGDDPSVILALSAGHDPSGLPVRGIVRSWRIGAEEPITTREVELGRRAWRFGDLVSSDGTLLIRRVSPDSDVIEDLATGADAVRIALPCATRAEDPLACWLLAASRGTGRLLYHIDRQLIVVDRSTGQPQSLEGEVSRLQECAATFSSDAKLVACGFGASDQVTIAIWDAITGARLHTIGGQKETVMALVFSPDGTRLISGNAGGELRIWDTTSGRPADWQLAVGHVDRIQAVAYDPSGDRIATGGQDRNVRMWDARSGRRVRIFSGHQGNVIDVHFSPDGSMIVSADEDGAVRVWDVTGADPRVLRAHTAYVYPVAFSPDGGRIFTGGWDGTVRVWDADSSDEIDAISNPDGLRTLFFSLAVSPDGRRLAVAESFNTGSLTRSWLRLLDTDTGLTEATFAQQEDEVGWRCVVFDPRGRRIAAADGKGVYLWDAESLERLPTLVSPAPDVVCVSFSHDGRLAATGCMNGEVQLVDVRTFQRVAVLSGHTAEVMSLDFSRNGALLATASKDRTARIWDVGTASEIAVLRGHTDVVHCVAFSPDGSRLASGSNDRTIRLWDVQSFTEVAQLRGHEDHIWSLAWSPDGRRLVSGSGDFTARIWEIDPLCVRLRARRARAQLLREVSPLVQRQYDELGDAENVIAHLKSDASLTGRKREIALQDALAAAVARRAPATVP